MTTDSQGFSGGVSNDTPTTAIEFRRWMAEQADYWPPHLLDAGTRAQLTLESLDQPDIEHAKKFMAASRKDLMDFAAAYAVWKADNGKSRLGRPN